MTIPQRDLAVLGGSFDPVHYGHVAIANTVSQCLGVTVCFVPVGQPAHKLHLVASPEQRLKMVTLAIEQRPDIVVNDLELKRGSVSRTYKTLCVLRDQLGKSKNLYFVLGMDAYLNLPSWHEWQKLLSVAHIIVCQRPGNVQLPPLLRGLENAHRVQSVDQLKTVPHGFIYYADNAAINVSSSEIRRRLRRSESVADIVDPAVLGFIKQQNLYESSSDEGKSE